MTHQATMTTSTVTITPPKDSELQTISVDAPQICIVGKSRDCDLIVPTSVDRGISRHHCLFDMNPPYATVKDLGSRNGTYVNGKKIVDTDEPVQLHDKDVVQLCNTVFRIGVTTPPSKAKTKLSFCIRCGDRVTSDRTHGYTEGDYLCNACRDASCSISDTMQLDADSLSAKQVVFGFRVIRRLGRGALGTVYLVQKRGSIKQSALKLMLPDAAVHDHNRMRFLREVEVLESLCHKNIVTLQGSGYDKGIFYIVLEYCNEGTLDELIKRDGPLSLPAALTIAMEILEALDYAHNAQLSDLERIIHRDIKPANVLLHRMGGKRRAKLADFGLCKAFNGSGLCSFTQTGTVAGTFSYMCKQQLLNYKDAKPEVDVWSTAAVLYFMLTGESPRVANTFTSILNAQPQSIQKFRDDLPDGLAEMLDEALLDHRDKLRYSTAAEFKQALERYL